MEMVPMEDAIKALLVYFVFPLLPIRESKYETPTELQQQSVAKQIHAVVVLYNYYHLKHSQKLEILGFQSFCKMCCVANPSLLAYMSHINEEDPENLYRNLSTTEKMVMDACKVCIGLDSSKEIPNIEGWRISKVAVFLVDHLRETCALQFGSTIEGVWSLVEKDIEAHHERKGGKLEQLAVSAVEQETGIHHSDLHILESHLTYSLSHEKTTTQLYIMSYGRSKHKEELIEVPIKDVIRSLDGPIVRRSTTSEVELTSVVEYYTLLPYIDIVSNWLSSGNTKPDSFFSPPSTKENHVVNEKNVSSVQKADTDRVKLSASGRRNKKIASRKKNNLKNARKYNKKSGRLIGTTNDGKVGDSKGYRLTFIGDNGTKKLSGLNDETLNIESAKMIRTENQILRKTTTSKIGSSHEVNRLQTVDGISEMEADSLTNVKESTKTGKSCQGGQSKETLIYENNNDKYEVPGRNVLSNTVRRKIRINKALGRNAPHKNDKGEPMKRIIGSPKTRTVQKEMPHNVSHTKSPEQPKADLNTETNKRSVPVVGRPSHIPFQPLDTPKTARNKENNPLQHLENIPATAQEDVTESTVPVKRALDRIIGSFERVGVNKKIQCVRKNPYTLPVVSEEAEVEGEDIQDFIAREVNFLVRRQLKARIRELTKKSFIDEPSGKKGKSPVNSGTEEGEDDVKISSEEGTNEVRATTIKQVPRLVSKTLGATSEPTINAGANNSTKTTCTSKCTVAERSNVGEFNRDGYPSGNLPLVPIQLSSHYNNAFHHMIESKKNDLMLASLRILHQKREELHLQHRLLEDEIARCDMNMHTIVTEGEENSESKAELITKALNSLCSSQVQTGANLSSEECSSQTRKRRKLSDAVLTSRNFCQELDDICQRNSWELPRYKVLPTLAVCEITRKFQADVTVEGMEFEINSEGDMKSSPREARESAAAHMLTKLRSMASQEQV